MIISVIGTLIDIHCQQMAFSKREPAAPAVASRGGPPLEARIAYLVGKLGHRQAVRFAELLKPLGLRPRHFALMNVVALGDGPSQQQVGEALGLDPSGLISGIDELEARDLIERRRDPADRRRYALFLTPAGETTLAQARKSVVKRGKELTASLSEPEAQTFHDLLLRVASADGLDLRPGADWD